MSSNDKDRPSRQLRPAAFALISVLAVPLVAGLLIMSGVFASAKPGATATFSWLGGWIAISSAGLITCVVAVGAYRKMRQQMKLTMLVDKSSGGRAIRVAARLLPTSARADYIEEWQSWMYDLSRERVPWHQRLIELLSVVFVAAPAMAVRLRRARPRASD